MHFSGKPFFLNIQVVNSLIQVVISKQADTEVRLWALSHSLTWVLGVPGMVSGSLSEPPVPRWAMQKMLPPELSCCIYTGFLLLHEVTLGLSSSPRGGSNYGGKFYWADIQDQVGLSFSLFSYWKIKSLS